MKQRFKIVFVISAIIIYPLFTHIYSQQNSKLKPIDSIIKNMKSNLGLINTHLSVKNKLFFEIDKKLLDKELLIKHDLLSCHPIIQVISMQVLKHLSVLLCLKKWKIKFF